MGHPVHTDPWSRTPRPPLEPTEAHVWRVALHDERLARTYWPFLSDDEQDRARRFYKESHRTRYVVAHGAMRLILAGYVGEPPDALEFTAGAHGKPAFAEGSRPHASGVEFNLSHSDDMALIAVTHGRPVGIDVERWSEEVEHLELAERFFSPSEREALRALADVPELIVAGFFAAWTRKEAYLKATGHGIARGLHHFDVTLTPGDQARLVADRLDALATDRWMMTSLVPGLGYSGALVVASPLHEVLFFDGDAVAEGRGAAASSAVDSLNARLTPK